MNFANLFCKNDPKVKNLAQSSIDIEQNSASIIYKNKLGTNHDTFQKNIRSPQPPLYTCEELSKNTLSPNHEEATKNFSKFQSKQNIMHQFEHYIVYNKLLGEGSFSKVYLGEVKKSKKLVAIKEVQKLEENQIACLMNSQSPYIIKLYSFWNINKHSYIALELCDGNLRQKLDMISTEEKMCLFEQIVEGMNYLNRKNIIHRDLKFENILLKNNIVKISDFGFAKPIGSKLAVFSQKCGTPYTMAPQIFFHNGQGKPIYTHKCDIYSLGVILHQMLYNRHPFDYSVQKMKLNLRVNINKKFGVLDVLIDRSLEHEVARRCNWTQFMQIFALSRMRKNQQNLQVLRQKNPNLNQTKEGQQKPDKKLNHNNLLKYRRPVFETPVKNETRKQNYPCKEKRNPFDKIFLPEKQNLMKKIEERKQFLLNEKRQNRQLSLIQQKLRQQAWKMEHDDFFEQRKENSVQTEAISAVKLVFLIIVIFGLIALLHHQFK